MKDCLKTTQKTQIEIAEVLHGTSQHHCEVVSLLVLPSLPALAPEVARLVMHEEM